MIPWAIQAHNPNGISIGSVVFAGLTTVTHRPTDHATQSVTIVVHYCMDMQSVHGFRCYDNIAPNAKCQRVLALALWQVCTVFLLIGSLQIDGVFLTHDIQYNYM